MFIHAKTVVLLNIIVEHVEHFFQDSLINISVG